MPGKTTIVDRVRMDRRFRGQGLGVYLTGLALDYLSHGSGVIALFPSPLEDLDAPAPRLSCQDGDNEEALAAARARLGRAWSRLGFEHYRNGTWILDPGTTALYKALCQEQQRLKGHRWNVTFTYAGASRSVMSAGIDKVTMAKSAPTPIERSGHEPSTCGGCLRDAAGARLDHHF
ncbi:hypothetical protein ACHGLA_00470 [Streptomyces sp. YH02]|uniref:hypothetical protein n=1 Tax=Streptomyces sp. YH02 TaxID=3256999 RepID=UPI00375789B1